MQRCLTWPEARVKHEHLRDNDEAGWGTLQREVQSAYGATLTAGPSPPSDLDWLSLYSNAGELLPFLVIQGPGRCNITCNLRQAISFLELLDMIFSVTRTPTLYPDFHTSTSGSKLISITLTPWSKTSIMKTESGA